MVSNPSSSAQISALIEALGGPNAVAALLQVTAQAVCNMRARGTIRPKYWPAIIAAAGERKLPGVTLAYLAQLMSQRGTPAAAELHPVVCEVAA